MNNHNIMKKALKDHERQQGEILLINRTADLLADEKRQIYYTSSL